MTMGKKRPDFEDESAKWIWLAISEAERKRIIKDWK